MMKKLVLMMLVSNISLSSRSFSEIRSEIRALPTVSVMPGFKARLARAKQLFQAGNYSATLNFLTPILTNLKIFSPKEQEEVTALVAHSKFELSDISGSRKHFVKLNDQTTLCRMVQIEAKRDDIKSLKKYYYRIKNPPDYVRYVFARALFINHLDAEAKPELERLLKSSEYGERATYILAALVGRNGDAAKASALFKGLENSQNSQLAELAKVAAARWAYMADKPEVAISIYKKMNYPNELASAQMLAGDLESDPKKAQNYYEDAQKNARDQNLKKNIFIRLNQVDRAVEISKVQHAEAEALKAKFENNDTTVFQDPWMLTQSEVIQLDTINREIFDLQKQIRSLETAYQILEIEGAVKIGWTSSRISELALEIRDLHRDAPDSATREEIEKIADELMEKQINDPHKMQAELFQSEIRLQTLKAEYEELVAKQGELTQALMQNKEKWLARLEVLTRDDGEASIRASIAKHRAIGQKLLETQEQKSLQIQKASQEALQ